MSTDSKSDDPTGPQPDVEPDRSAQPVDAEGPPRLPFPVVAVGASAGGLEAYGEFLAAMPADSGMAFVLIQHLAPDRESMVADILARKTAMPVRQIEEGMAVEPDHVYVIRPGHTLTLADGRFRFGPQPARRFEGRPVDDFFRSLAEHQRERAVAVVMSGMGSNGTAGAQAVRAVGGLVIAQDPATAQFPSMPRHLIDQGYADDVLRPADIPDALLAYAASPYAREGRLPADGVGREDRHLREIVTALRARARRDFSGYKTPTVLRRVQRRMGLNRITDIGEYAKLVMRSPTEVAALADDLLIHVTGFFRDPEAWEALREKVVAPLVAGRDPDTPVRAWVTACSSGEEAYSLAMLLVEEAERANKPLGITVFATDMAERTLAQARQGVYPGGIETEMPPERLDRFFEKQDAVYRARADLRERVVFAPQNVLSDPPFSRLDIVTCRNMLIYLEPALQQRVLALAHFGLRDGGALFLGSSETVAGADDLFEPIDKKARIFRRVGPTRHGLVEFPLPHAVRALPRPRPAGDEPRPAVQPNLAQLTERAVLDHHAPVAVTIDRDQRVLYHHGNTVPFIAQPHGEVTRDLLTLTHPGLRDAVRLALFQAATDNRPATVPAGWLETDSGRARVVVTASPAGGARPPEYFVVSFVRHTEPPASPDAEPHLGDADADAAEVRRVRDELRSTVEELQAANEEHKAANEEVMSINEELQSANEELETSKEEMQSLNEELVTVNAQLRAKMDELQGTTTDLACLLTSTDIAVLFLDARLRIRRFTPAARQLVELIASDVGRPLADLARKFDDPHLDDDVRAVLDKLTPVERKVAAADRHYYRRVLPYRTTDNRIDGVVVTFVDVTERERAERTLRQSERRFRALVTAGATTVAVYRMSPDWTEMRQLDGRWLTSETDSPSDTWLDRYVLPDDRPLVLEAIAAAVRSKDVFELEHRVRRADGTPGWTHSRAVPVLDEAGEIAEWCGVATDVTVRRQAEEALRASEERFRPFADSANVGVAQTDPAGRYTYANPQFCELVGRPLEGLLGLRIHDITHPDDLSDNLARFDRLVRGGSAFTIEKRYLRPDGGTVWVINNVAPVRGPDDRLVSVVVVSVDVTDRRRAEAEQARLRDELAAERALLRAVLDQLPVGVVVAETPSGRVLVANALARLPWDGGWSEVELHGADERPVVGPLDRFLAQAVAGQSVRAEVRRDEGDGRTVWYRVSAAPVRNAAGVHAWAVLVLDDVTAEKEAEAILRQSHLALETRVEAQEVELTRTAATLETEATARREAERERQQLIVRLTTITEDERQRISRELHDETSQLLAALIVGLKAVREQTDVPAPSVRALEALQGQADQVSQVIHRIAWELRPAALDALGLDAALRSWTERWSEWTGVPVKYHSTLGAERLQSEIEVQIYRLVSEALSNVAKHANASRVSVLLERLADVLIVSVEDDGTGFDPDAPTNDRSRLGLLGMRERAALLGGTLDFESAPGRGTTVLVRVPLTPSPGESPPP